jgi:hypothetical protein
MRPVDRKLDTPVLDQLPNRFSCMVFVFCAAYSCHRDRYEAGVSHLGPPDVLALSSLSDRRMEEVAQ